MPLIPTAMICFYCIVLLFFPLEHRSFSSKVLVPRMKNYWLPQGDDKHRNRSSGEISKFKVKNLILYIAILWDRNTALFVMAESSNSSSASSEYDQRLTALMLTLLHNIQLKAIAQFLTIHTLFRGQHT